MRLLIAAVAAAVASFAFAGCSSTGSIEMAATELPAPDIEPRPGSFGIWTGEEAIVFGGRESLGDERWWTDGAAYSPATGQWRDITGFPFPEATVASIAWNGQEMIVIAVEGDDPSNTTALSAAYDPKSNLWRPLPGPDLSRPAGTPTTSPAGISTAAGPSVTGTDGTVVMIAAGKTLVWQPDTEAWFEPLASDDRLARFERSSGLVLRNGLIYQGVSNRGAQLHGLVTTDAASGLIVSVEELTLPGDLAAEIVGPLHPIFDGDELLLLGVESAGSAPRKATVLAEGDSGWEIVAQTDDENFAGIGTSSFHSLVIGDDAFYSLHFNTRAGVFVPSERIFGILELADLDRCALADGAVWTGSALFGWNGGHCLDEAVLEFQPEANRSVIVEPPAD